jgi:hypothetical protein
MEAWILYTWMNVVWCELWVLKGSETHENGNFDKRWIFDDLHVHTLVILLLHIWLVGLFVSCPSFLIPLGHFKILGLEKGFIFILVCQGLVWWIIIDLCCWETWGFMGMIELDGLCQKCVLESQTRTMIVHESKLEVN